MRFLRPVLTLALAAVLTSGAAAATKPTILMPNQLHWTSKGLPAGISMAVLSGDPNGSGMYVIRLKMVPGSLYPPHTHGKAEMVTVLSGTLMAGIGTSVHKAHMMALGPGTFVTMPPGTPHYVMAKTATTVDVAGMGPDTTTMLRSGK